MCTENNNNTLNTEETRTYSVAQVEKLFGVAQTTVHAMIRDGRLDGKKVGRRYLITEDSIKKLVLGDKE